MSHQEVALASTRKSVWGARGGSLEQVGQGPGVPGGRGPGHRRAHVGRGGTWQGGDISGRGHGACHPSERALWALAGHRWGPSCHWVEGRTAGQLGPAELPCPPPACAPGKGPSLRGRGHSGQGLRPRTRADVQRTGLEPGRETQPALGPQPASGQPWGVPSSWVSFCVCLFVVCLFCGKAQETCRPHHWQASSSGA